MAQSVRAISSSLAHAPRRPNIGVTGPDRGGEALWRFTQLAIFLAGGRAVRITPQRPLQIDTLAGLVLGGGADVGPNHYGEQLKQPAEITSISTLRRPSDFLIYPSAWLFRKVSEQTTDAGIDVPRDRLEFRLLGEAVERGLPVLGICRGEQLINVFFGGTLHQQLTGFYTEDPEIRTILPRKKIAIQPGTLLASLMMPLPTRVNALHRQGVARLGAGIRLAATDRNGIIQAIEHTTLPFLIGVQWHPEFMPQSPRQRRLFAGLVEHAARKRPLAHQTLAEVRATG